MKKEDLPDLRKLAAMGAIEYSGHAIDRMLERGVSTENIEEILKSSSNQLIEVQSPSKVSGKEHSDERDLIFDPCNLCEIVVVIVILFTPTPSIRVVTVENVDGAKWIKYPDRNPSLVRVM